MDRFHATMTSHLYGNPHSASPSSLRATEEIESVRLQALKYFGFDPETVDLVFTANTTAAIKLVAEAFREHADGFRFGYHVDSHTSIVGLRALANTSTCLESDVAVEQWLDAEISEDRSDQLGLFAYPAQSNMNGSRLPLGRTSRLNSNRRPARTYTLLDAASFAPTSQLRFEDSVVVPDFTVLSFSKVFGFPDLGALIVRKDAAHIFDRRKYFGGGTVDMVVCVKEQWQARKSGPLHSRLEDGTLPIHSILALKAAMQTHAELFRSLDHITKHTTALAAQLHQRLSALRHANGQPVCTIYKDKRSTYGDIRTQGPIFAFNLRDGQDRWVSNTEVEKLAAIKNVHLRTGGLCNPGGLATALDLAPWEMRENFSAGFRCGAENDILNGKPTGVIRVSLGAMNTRNDVDRFVAFIEEFFVEKSLPSINFGSPSSTMTSHLYIESLTVYPIKSCAGWQIPYGTPWDVHGEGLAWDREWCLVKQADGKVLSQKNYPRMALVRPQLDFDAGVLRVTLAGSAEELTVPLSKDPRYFAADTSRECLANVCGDTITARQYTSPAIADFFTRAIGVPCTFARFPAPGRTSPSSRHSKPHLRRHANQSRPPLLLSNESPILTISRSSLNRLNELIKAKGGKAVPAAVFRANLVVAERPPPLSSTPLAPRSSAAAVVVRENPWAEDAWRGMRLGGPAGPVFDFLGGCRRCQMLCVDQESAEKNQEPFVTLAKTRRVEGKVMFGVHTAMRQEEESGQGSSSRAVVRVGDAVETWQDFEE